MKNFSKLTLLTIAIFLLGFFVRFYQLGVIPNGLYPDETALGYNAYSILQSGRDEYGVKMPLYFRSFDDYKLPVYIYSTALSLKVFGVNAFAVRFVSALFGSLAVIALYFLLFELSRKKDLSMLGSFFLALNPWHVFFSRAGYEVNVATSLILLGTLFFVMAVKRKNTFWLFVPAILMFLLSVYTYNVTRLMSPVIFSALILYYYKQLTSVSKKVIIGLLLLFFIGMLPFVITFIALQAQPGFASHQDALITGKEAQAEFILTRSYFVGLPTIVQKVLFNYWLLVAWHYLRNLVSFFSTSFFFVVGADHPSENIGGGFGMFYYFELPLLLWGAYQGIKQKVSFLYPFYVWFLVIFFVGSIVIAVPNGTRTYLAVIPLTVFSAYGLYTGMQHLARLKNTLVKRSVLMFFVALMGYSYLFYFLSYTNRFPIELAKEWRSEDEKTVTYLTSVEKNYQKIVFDDSAEFFYTSLLFYGKYSPRAYQQQAVYKESGLVNTLSHVGKYEFRKVDWDRELAQPGTLFVIGKDTIPGQKKPEAVFSYPTRPVVFYYDRKIAQFPTTDVAYQLFSSGKTKK